MQFRSASVIGAFVMLIASAPTYSQFEASGSRTSQMSTESTLPGQFEPVAPRKESPSFTSPIPSRTDSGPPFTNAADPNAKPDGAAAYRGSNNQTENLRDISKALSKKHGAADTR
jgi:hypothetical protein